MAVNEPVILANSMQQRKKTKIPASLFIIAIFFVVGAASFFLGSFTRAQPFKAPIGPAPDNGALNNYLNLTNYLKKDEPSGVLKGSLIVASSTPAAPIQSSAILGDFINNVGLTGYAGINGEPPRLSTYALTGSAVYGYANNASGIAVGVYGTSTSDGGGTALGVVGETQVPGGSAAVFSGRVAINDPFGAAASLNVDDLVTAPQLQATSSIQIVPAIAATGGGISVRGGFKYGLIGQSENSYGIYAKSLNSAMRIANKSCGGACPTKSIGGLRGDTSNATGSAGVFGWSAAGNGVTGIVGAITTGTLYAVRANLIGTGSGGGNYSSAVYGQGGAYAGYFEGDVELKKATSTLFIGSTGIDQTSFLHLMAWCGAACPDSY